MVARKRLICASAVLVERGPGVRFEIGVPDEAESAFAIRSPDGVHAFVNSCPHAGSQLDWQPGRFFGDRGLYLVCATHGALFDPASGHCLAGRCQGVGLRPLPLREHDGFVYLIEGY